MTQLTYKELKPGMLVKRYGLILQVGKPGSKTKLFGKSAWLRFLDYNDPYYGPCLGTVKATQKFEILHEDDTPEYNKVLKSMLKELRGNCTVTIKTIGEVTRYL